jgi:hypothetical protein
LSQAWFFQIPLEACRNHQSKASLPLDSFEQEASALMAQLTVVQMMILTAVPNLVSTKPLTLAQVQLLLKGLILALTKSLMRVLTKALEEMKLTMSSSTVAAHLLRRSVAELSV